MNENLIEKYQNGELSDAEILAADLAAKRAEIKRQADQRAVKSAETEAAEQKREQRLERMVSIDRATEAATRDYERLFQKFDDFVLAFGQELVQTKGRIISAQTAFGREVNAAVENVGRIKVNYAPEIEAKLEELLETLKNRGAALSSVCFDGWQPHLHYAPVFCRQNAYEPKDRFLFAELVGQIERMIVARLAAMPEDEPEEPPKPLEKAA